MKTVKIIFRSCLAVVIAIVGWYFIQTVKKASPDVGAAIIAAFAGLVVALITHSQTKIREINSRHFSEKRETYTRIIDLVFKFLIASRDGIKINNEDVFGDITIIKKNLLIWADSNVLRAWLEFEAESKMYTMENFLRSARKDLGHDDVSLPVGALVSLVVKANEREFISEKVRAKQI